MKLTIPRKNLIIHPDMSGGSPEEIIEDINLNDSNVDRKLIATLDNHYQFRFTQGNTQNYNGAKYLGKGALTAVYKIKLVSQNLSTGYTISDKYKDELILRIYENMDISQDIKLNDYKGLSDIEIGGEDTYKDAQSKFINMWTEHKQLFPENIIDIFMYGEIMTNTKYLGYYTLTRTYSDEKKLNELSLINKIKYLKKLLEFLIKLRHNGYTYRDLKYPNIGYDKINDEYNFIVLDYDTVTILKYHQVENLKTEYTIEYTVGTYTPLYILEQKEKFEPDLMYVGGLLYTIRDLFKNLPNDNYASLSYKLNNYIRPVDKNIRKYIQRIDELISFSLEKKEYEIQLNDDIYGRDFLNIANTTKLIEDIDKDIKQTEIYIDRIQTKIEDLISLGTELISEINKYKYENLTTIEDKITYIIGRIIKACIPFNYDKAADFNDLVTYSGLIKLLDDIIHSEEKPSTSVLQKYLKYKQKYLKLKATLI